MTLSNPLITARQRRPLPVEAAANTAAKVPDAGLSFPGRDSRLYQEICWPQDDLRVGLFCRGECVPCFAVGIGQLLIRRAAVFRAGPRMPDPELT